MSAQSVDRHELVRDVRATLMPGFVGLEAPGWIVEALGNGLQSVCVYGNNIESAEQVRALGRSLRSAAPHALLAIDEEGGEVTRLHYREGSPYPGAAVLGRIDDPAFTEEIGRRVAADILNAGFNLALAPVADVNSNPLNPVIGTRSFGSTPDLVSRHVSAWVRGLTGAGAVACPKHFPGHGDTDQDSHLALPVVGATRQELKARELPPFGAAFGAGARAVMTSHILLPGIDPDSPATFSRAILQDVLRDALGFTGVIVSDALDMQGASGEIGIPEAAVRALGAGCDLLCIGVDTTSEQFEEIVAHVVAAVAGGRISAERIAQAAARVRDLAESAAPPQGQAVALHANAGEVARIADSFDGAGTARAWVADHPHAAVIRIDTAANMAVGVVPWGPFAQLAEGTLAHREQFTVSDAAPASELSLPFLRERGAVIVGRDMHRHGFARHAIDELRAAGVPLLTAEMGWPASRDYADIASYGSSVVVGAALISLLEGSTS